MPHITHTGKTHTCNAHTCNAHTALDPSLNGTTLREKAKQYTFVNILDVFLIDQELLELQTIKQSSKPAAMQLMSCCKIWSNACAHSMFPECSLCMKDAP